MKDKITNSKKAILILLSFISFAAIYGIYTVQFRTASSQEDTNQNKLYMQTAVPTIFAQTQNLPTVTLNWHMPIQTY